MFFCQAHITFLFIFCLIHSVFANVEGNFKCSLPDVKSNRTDLDLSRFRSDFSKVSEVKFPGLIGPQNERLICKIKCIDGNWVGPLCSTTDGRFQPLFRDCLYVEEHPLLLLSFKNMTVQKGTSLSHGSVIAVRCKKFGLYKLNGASLTRCHNGEWSTKLPICIPTMLITNFTGDAPPSLTYQLGNGSAWVDSSGELWVYPESWLHIDCVSTPSEQDPVWSWTQKLHHYDTAWSPLAEQNSTHFRLTLGKMSAKHSDQYTCASPNGETNTITVKVVNVVCPKLELNDVNMIQSDEGIRLGQSLHLSCKPGFQINGTNTLTCTGSGRWSDRLPTCVETYCPILKWSNPHLSLVDFNSSVGGKAVFQCAWGYRLVGGAAVECQADGKWKGDVPACAGVYCPKPLTPQKGFIAGKIEDRHSVGDLLVYRCDEGKRMVGESSVVCTENGYWSNPPPFCVDQGNSSIANDTDWFVTTLDTIFIDNVTLVQYQQY